MGSSFGYKRARGILTAYLSVTFSLTFDYSMVVSDIQKEWIIEMTLITMIIMM